MLSTLQTRYQRVEKALDALIESVSAYAPSLTAADELVAADEAVNESLEERECAIDSYHDTQLTRHSSKTSHKLRSYPLVASNRCHSRRSDQVYSSPRS